MAQISASIRPAGGSGLYRHNSGPANSDVFGNVELEYSVEYLDQFVDRLNSGCPLVEVVPNVQLDYTQSFIASRLTMPKALVSGRGTNGR